LAAAAHPVGNECPLLFGHSATDLEPQVIMRVVTHWTFEKLHVAPVLGQFFEEYHLMDIVTCSPIRGGEQKPRERAQGGAIAQPIQPWPVELCAAVAIIPVDRLIRQMPVRLHRDVLPQAGELVFNRLLLLLPIG
jgi:hypothetical protein